MANPKIRFQYPTSMVLSFFITLCCFVCLQFPASATAKNSSYEIRVHAGEIEETIEYFKSKNFWGEEKHDRDLDVPRIVLVVGSKRWQKESQKIPVTVKKELFYRTIVPLVLLANELILEERQELMAISEQVSKGKTLSAEEQGRLQILAEQYRVQYVTPRKKQIAALLERVDAIPPSLALG